MSEDRTPMANIAPFGLRMQPDLKARIEASARENNRSLNAEIVQRLEQSLLLPPIEISDDLASRIRNSPSAWRPARSKMLIDALEDWYPKPPPPRLQGPAQTAWDVWLEAEKIVEKDEKLLKGEYLDAFYLTITQMVNNGIVTDGGLDRIKGAINDLLAGKK